MQKLSITLVMSILLYIGTSYGQNTQTSDSILPFKNGFVIKINPNIGSNTNGHTIHDVYFEIINNCVCKNILFLFPESGFQKSYTNLFFSQILKIPYKKRETDHYLFSDSIYKNFSNSALTELIYLYHSSIYFQEILKFTDIKKLRNLPLDVIDTSQLPKYSKTQLDSNYYHTKIDKYLSANGTLFQLSDANNRFCKLNFENGNIEQCLDLSSLNAVFLYEKYCNPSPKDLKLAKSYDPWFEEHNRQSIMINSCFYSQSDSSLYFSISIQVYMYLKKSITIPGKNGQPVVIPKKTPIAESFTLFLHTDLNLNVLNIYGLKNPNVRISRSIYPLTMETFFIHNDTLFVFNEPDKLSDYETSKRDLNAISYYILKNDKFVFKGTLNPKIIKNINQYNSIALNNSFIPKENKLFVIQDSNPQIYELGKPKGKDLNISHLEESFPSRIDLEKDILMNFRTIAIKVTDKNLIYILYENQKEVKLDILNSEFNKLQSINLKLKKDWFYFRAFFYDEFLVIPEVQRGGIFLIKIPLFSKY